MTVSTWLRVAVLSVTYACIHAYPNGAPESSCVSLIPGHGDPLTSSRYSISLPGNVANYQPSGHVTVQINGGTFGGLIMQARRFDGQQLLPGAVGTWVTLPSGTRKLDCGAPGDTVTHSSTVDKGANGPAMFTWQAPTVMAGDIKFIATVAVNKGNYQLNVESPTLLQHVPTASPVPFARRPLNSSGASSAASAPAPPVPAAAPTPSPPASRLQRTERIPIRDLQQLQFPISQPGQPQRFEPPPHQSSRSQQNTDQQLPSP